MYSLSPSSEDDAGDFELSDLPELGRDGSWPAVTVGVIMAVACRQEKDAMGFRIIYYIHEWIDCAVLSLKLEYGLFTTFNKAEFLSMFYPVQ